MRLARVGVERVIGSLAGRHRGVGAQPGTIEHPVAQVAQIPPRELSRELAGDPGWFQVIDVRRERSGRHGHIDGARAQTAQPVGIGARRSGPQRPIVVHCKGGYRSAIACSLIRARRISERDEPHRRFRRLAGLRTSGSEKQREARRDCILTRQDSSRLAAGAAATEPLLPRRRSCSSAVPGDNSRRRRRFT